MNEKFKEDFLYFKELLNTKDFKDIIKKYSWLTFVINSMSILCIVSSVAFLNQKDDNNDIYLICSFIIIGFFALCKYFKRYELINNKLKIKESYKVYLRYNKFNNSIYNGSLFDLFEERNEILDSAIIKNKESIVSNYKIYNGITGSLVIVLLSLINNEEYIDKVKKTKKVENYINEIENIDYLVK